MKNKYFWSFIIVLFIVIQVWFVYVTFTYPYLGINVEKNSNDEWVITSLDKESGALQLNLEIGDIIQKIDGIGTENYFSVNRWRTIEQADVIEVIQSGKLFEVSTENIQDSLLASFLPLLGEILSFSVCLLLIIRVKQSKSSLLLAFVFLCGGLTFMSLGASVRGDTIAKLTINSTLATIPVLFLHFLCVFLKEKGNVQLPIKYIKYLYLFIPVITFLRLTEAIFGRGSNSYYSISLNITMLFFILGIFLNFFVLSFVYIKYRNDESYLASMIRTIWISLFISFLPSICFSFFPLLVFRYEWISTIYTSWFILIFPLSFAYLIMTKQLYDVHIVLRRIMYTVIISVLPAMLIVTIVFTLAMEVSHLKLFFLFIITLVLISSILYSLEYITTKLEAILFPRKYQLRVALKNISKSLGKISSFRDLNDIILQDIVDTLQVHGGALVTKHNEFAEVVGKGNIDLQEVEKMIQAGHKEHPMYSIFEINRQKGNISYLVMTRKQNGTRLGFEEIQWLNLIISYLSVSMENVYLIRTLTTKLEHLAAQNPTHDAADDFAWFRKLMFELQEKERIRIATDIHDTTMQDLFFLKRKLSNILGNRGWAAGNQEELKGIIDYVEIINTNLRQNCFELHPYLLTEIGLVQTVRKIVEQENSLNLFEIYFITKGEEWIEQRDIDIKRHLFRMIQELLNNAKKHSRATIVKLRLTATNKMLKMNYEDNGVGFEQDKEILPEIGGGGIGMEQLRSRVVYLDGEFILKTSKGQGVHIEITIPGRKE